MCITLNQNTLHSIVFFQNNAFYFTVYLPCNFIFSSGHYSDVVHGYNYAFVIDLNLVCKKMQYKTILT